MNIKNINVNWTKVAGIGGAVLSVGASLLTAWAGDKKRDEIIEKKVQEAIDNLTK